MATIYTQLQRKSDSKWVTVSYSDEYDIPHYLEHGGPHDTEEQARAAWQESDERKRLFPQALSKREIAGTCLREIAILEADMPNLHLGPEQPRIEAERTRLIQGINALRLVHKQLIGTF